MIAWLISQVDWLWLSVGLLVGWNLLKQPKWVSDILAWLKKRIFSLRQ